MRGNGDKLEKRGKENQEEQKWSRAGNENGRPSRQWCGFSITDTSPSEDLQTREKHLGGVGDTGLYLPALANVWLSASSPSPSHRPSSFDFCLPSCHSVHTPLTPSKP